jgi:anti-sigma regulatory factor (Ser/Thr protein kinase)
MCRFATAQFEAGNSAPSAARHWVNGLLDHWELTALSDNAALITSEVVTNAVRHASSAPTLTAAVVGGFLEVGVTDSESQHLPERDLNVDSGAENGRGLNIVQALADDWGTSLLPHGKQVWFRMDVHDWPYLPACRCPEDHDPDVVELASGRLVLPNPGPWD